MNITIVIFRAFDKTCTEVFWKNETDLQIHNKLTEICSTYIPQHKVVGEMEAVSINTLLIHKI